METARTECLASRKDLVDYLLGRGDEATATTGTTMSQKLASRIRPSKPLSPNKSHGSPTLSACRPSVIL